MKPCPHCERPCPDRAMVCPHCGYLFSAEMQGGHWVRAPWRPDPASRRPRVPGSAGGVLPTDTEAMLSLAFGIAAFFGAWLLAGTLLAVPGLICGMRARRRIRRARGSLAGEAAAQTALALCVMALGIGLCLFLWIALHWPVFLRDFSDSWSSAVRQFAA